MIRFCVYVIFGALTALLLSGCNVSFQSSQFNFVKGLFAQESPQPEKNWQVRWQGKIYPVFAVNHDGGTFFADEHGFIVSFDGWQIRQVSVSQSKDGKIAVIEKTTTDDGAILLDYSDGNARPVRRPGRRNARSAHMRTGTSYRDFVRESLARVPRARPRARFDSDSDEYVDSDGNPVWDLHADLHT